MSLDMYRVPRGADLLQTAVPGPPWPHPAAESHIGSLEVQTTLYNVRIYPLGIPECAENPTGSPASHTGS